MVDVLFLPTHWVCFLSSLLSDTSFLAKNRLNCLVQELANAGPGVVEGKEAPTHAVPLGYVFDPETGYYKSTEVGAKPKSCTGTSSMQQFYGQRCFQFVFSRLAGIPGPNMVLPAYFLVEPRYWCSVQSLTEGQVFGGTLYLWDQWEIGKFGCDNR